MVTDEEDDGEEEEEAVADEDAVADQSTGDSSDDDAEAHGNAEAGVVQVLTPTHQTMLYSCHTLTSCILTWQDVLTAEKSGKGYRLLVRWQGTNPATNMQWENSWEPRSNLHRAAKNDTALGEKIATL